MKKSILTTVLSMSLLSVVAEARTPEEIKKSGVVKFGLRERDLVYKAAGPKQLHTIVGEAFAEFLSTKFGTKVKVEHVVAKDMATLWKNDAGEVKQGESYTPQFLAQVDVYTDVLTVNEWREKLATPIRFLPTKESFLCNFQTGKLTFAKAKTDKVKIYTVKDSSFHTLLTKAGFEEKELSFVADTQALVPAIEGEKGQACTLLDSDFTLFTSRGNKKLSFAGPAVEKAQALAWWVAKSDTALGALVQEFWTKYQSSPEWTKMFEETYGIPFAKYLVAVGTF